MLNFYKQQTFMRFTADVFMCEQCHTGNGLAYWNLRLLSKGQMIDAFHWDNVESPILTYRERDGILVLGKWNSAQKNRLQVLKSKMICSAAANDDEFDPNAPVQLELDFSD